MDEKSILIIDDEEIIRRLCSRILTKLGHKLVMAGGMQEAFDAMDAAPFDLLVTDLRLPDGHGVDVIKRFKKKFPRRNAIVITGSLTPDESLLGLEKLGAVLCLPKPFEAATLEQAVQNELKRLE